MANLSFEIQKSFGVLSKNDKEWQKEINIVRWHENRPKLDIRDWDSEHKKMGRGITFTPEEVEKAIEVFKSIDVEILREAYNSMTESDDKK